VDFDEITLMKDVLDCCSEGLERRGMGEQEFMVRKKERDNLN
jgi:hypothetical protein